MNETMMSVDHFYEIALRWRTVSVRNGEMIRWRCVDGRWISIGFGDGDGFGEIVVRNWAGVREHFDSYEAALALAARWRLSAG